MKRKHANAREEQSRSSKFLFNNSKDFVEKLTPAEYSDDDLDKKPVWIDEDDYQFMQTNDKSKTRSENLKEKYKYLMGTPSWAKLKHSKDIDDDNEMLRTVGHVKKKKPIELPKELLEIKKLSNINSETRNEGSLITCVEFHPKLSVSLVSGNSGIVSLFSIGGEENRKLHSFRLEKWKLISSAQFTPSGSEAYLSSKLNSTYCLYDLIKAQPKLIQLPQIIDKSKIFKLSPDGKFIATSAGYDEVYILSTASKEIVRTLKHNSNIVTLTFSCNTEHLYCYSIEGEITIWDLSTYRALKKFYDNGCVKASCLTISSCGKLLATGSCEGIVNIYETLKIDTMEPIPIKTITNLTSKITKLMFNPTTEILAASSAILPNAMKLIHIPSYQVYKNFPDQMKNFSQIETLNFSPNSGYFAMGNSKGCAYLYRLKYYKNY